MADPQKIDIRKVQSEIGHMIDFAEKNKIADDELDGDIQRHLKDEYNMSFDQYQASLRFHAEKQKETDSLSAPRNAAISAIANSPQAKQAMDILAYATGTTQDEKFKLMQHSLLEITSGAKQLYYDIAEDREWIAPEEAIAAEMAIKEEVDNSWLELHPLTKNTGTGKALNWLYKTGPYMMLPGGPTKGAIKKIFYGGLIGAGTTSTQYIDPESEVSRMDLTIRGALFGAGIPAAFSLAQSPVAQKYIRMLDEFGTYRKSDLIAKEINSRTASNLGNTIDDWTGLSLNKYGRLAKDAKKVAKGRPEIDLPVGQTSPEPAAQEAQYIISKESQSANRDFYRNINNQHGLMAFHKSTLERYGNASGETKNTFFKNVVRPKHLKNLRDLKIIRRNNWASGWKEVENYVGKQRVFDLSDTRDFTLERMKNLRQMQRLDDAGPSFKGEIPDDMRDLPKPFVKALERTEKMLKRGPITASQYKSLMQMWGNLSKSEKLVITDQAQRNGISMAGKMYERLNTDMDTFINSSTPNLANATKALRNVRTRYAHDSEAINAINTSTLGSVLGKNVHEINGEDLIKNIDSLGPEELEFTFDLLDSYDPSFRNSVASMMVEDAFEAAMIKGDRAAGFSALNTDEFYSRLPKGKKLTTIFKDAGFKKDMDLTLKALERINIRLLGGGGLNPAETISQGAMVSASTISGNVAAAPFQAGLAARLMTPGMLKKLSTSEGRSLLQAAANAKTPKEFIIASTLLLHDDIEFQSMVEPYLGKIMHLEKQQGPKGVYEE